MVKCPGIIVVVAIILTSEFASAEDTLLTSAAKVVQLKRQMYEDVLVVYKTKTEDLNALKQFAITMKALKAELKAFGETGYNGQESLLGKTSFAKVKRTVRADKLYALGGTLMGCISQSQTKKLHL